MKIESMEVIPMNKESIFEENELYTFECVNITTSYDEWKIMHDANLENYNKLLSRKTNPDFDSDCELFARSHKAFMLGPTAKFDRIFYEVKTRIAHSREQLFTFEHLGPLYYVMKECVDDIDAGKTVERTHIDETCTETYGLWYPLKTIYKIRHGVEV